MIAIVLTAGEGGRLKNLKACRSKSMLPIDGKPILELRLQQICLCKEIDKLYIVIHPLETDIQQYFGNSYNNIPIQYVKQKLPKSGILNAVYSIDKLEDLYKNDVMLILGDEYYKKFDTYSLVNNFNKNRNMNVVVIPTNDIKKIKNNYTINISSNMEITDEIEKPQILFNNYIGTGTILIPKGFLEQFYKNNSNNINNLELIDLFKETRKCGNKVFAFEMKTQYLNINTKEEYSKIYTDKSNEIYDNEIIHYFKKIVIENSNQKAVVLNDESLTYEQLDRLSEIVCNNLKKIGIDADNCIGLMCSRTIYHLVALIAILKLDNYYLPIDEKLPIQRIQYMINKSNTKFIIGTKQAYDGLDFNKPILFIEDLINESYNPSIKMSVKLSDNKSKTQYAYVIFTSGSTGLPKGIVIKSKSVINLVLGMKKEVYNHINGEKLNVGVMASFGFDLSVQQIYSSLLLGHTLHIIPSEVKVRPKELIQYLNKIDMCDITPLILDMIANYLIDNKDENLKIKHFVSAGEELKKDIACKILKISPNLTITNAYGPTECTVQSTMFNLDSKNIANFNTIPIGKPMENTRVYVLDENKKIISPCITGEIWISGDGVGGGYINDEELTNQNFHVDLLDEKGIMYKTGDKGFWGLDGNLYYKGRIDNQVKFKGYRIELFEIEKVIEQLEQISSCRVFLLEDNKAKTAPNKILVAYIIIHKDIQLDEIINYLSKKLPDYMIPQAFVPVKEFKINNNGKVDKNVLPDFNVNALRTLSKTINNELYSYIKKDSLFISIEKCISKYIETVLYDQSLISLGFDSLLLMQLLMDIENYLKIRINNFEWNLHLSFVDIYYIVKKNIDNISNDINKETNIKSNVSTRKINYVNAMPMQKYLVKVEQMNKSTQIFRYFNQMIFFVPVSINTDNYKLEEAFIHIQKSCDAFNMQFQMTGKHLKVYTNHNIQTINKYELEDEKFDFDDFSTIFDSEFVDKILNKINDNMLDMQQLVQFNIFELKNTKLLIFSFHHVMFDYLSFIYFIKKLEYYYYNTEDISGEVIEDNSFTNYMIEYNQYLKSDEVRNKSLFWSDMFEKSSSINLNSVVNNIMKNNKFNNIQLSVFDKKLLYATDDAYYNSSTIISNDLIHQFKEYCRKNEVSEFSLLFTVMLNLINKYSQKEYATLLFFTSGRNNLRPIDTIGFFSYLLCFICDNIDFNSDYLTLIRSVENKMKILHEYEDGFANCFDENKKSEILSSSIIFDYQQLYNANKSKEKLWNYAFNYETVGVSNQLSFRIFDYNEKLHISILYNTNNINHEEIKILMSEYIRMLKEVFDYGTNI